MKTLEGFGGLRIGTETIVGKDGDIGDGGTGCLGDGGSKTCFPIKDD